MSDGSESDDDDDIYVDHGGGGGHDDDGVRGGSPPIPSIPDRPSSMFRSNTYTEVVMSSIAFNNKKAVDPAASYSISSLVSEPDLDDAMMATSTLSFLNVADNLDVAISSRIELAKSSFIDEMARKSAELQSLKNVLRSLQAYGSTAEAVADGVEFESTGDVQRDIEELWTEINRRQQELYDMDCAYRPGGWTLLFFKGTHSLRYSV